MRSGAPAFGTPENAKANVASGQLARRYRLPYRTSNASASNVADAQGAYETQMSLWGAVLGGGNLVYHAAGWQEGGLTASFEKFILDVEMLQMMMEFLQPIAVDEAALGFDAIRRVATGGHFFGDAHDGTLRARLLPAADIELAELRELGAGSQTTRGRRKPGSALQEYEQPALAPRCAGTRDYVARRRDEIRAGEP
jgi:trimethylamine--corrinoid protein Co-methyltransferase